MSCPPILDTYAEAFDMRWSRLIVTAIDRYWLDAALGSLTGYATSVIACDAEVGIEQWLSSEHSPDGRPGAAVLCFGFSAAGVGKAIVQRVGQTVMTCPTTAVFASLEDQLPTLPLGKSLRFFGDGFQKSKQIGGVRYWRVPVMDGEFMVAEQVSVGRGIGGGNLIFQWEDCETGLEAARAAVEAIGRLPGVITPFPGGIARSGSKVSSRYPSLIASTADAYCPTLKGRVDSQLVAGANGCYEIVIDGVDRSSIELALTVGIAALSDYPLLAIGAGNYGGRLGKHLFHLRDYVEASRLIAGT